MEILRKVFIDCGAWNGDSIKAFKKYNNDDFEIYGFECEPRLTEELEIMSNELNFTFINRAVWVNDDNIKLYPGKGDLTQSSSLSFNKKKYIDIDNPVVVKGIDFSRWIIDNFDKKDYILCKMNIEGAEYEVLPRMLKDGSIDYINKFYMSWHWRKLRGFTETAHNKLIEEVGKRTILLKWLFVEGEKEDVF